MSASQCFSSSSTICARPRAAASVAAWMIALGHVDLVMLLIVRADSDRLGRALESPPRLPSLTRRDVFYQAAGNGQLDLVEHFLTESPTQDVSHLLHEAITAGDVALARVLISSGNPHGRNVLRPAAASGHIEIVELLLPTSDLDSVNEAISWASLYEHVVVVRLLDRADSNSLGPALDNAASAGQVGVMSLLGIPTGAGPAEIELHRKRDEECGDTRRRGWRWAGVIRC